MLPEPATGLLSLRSVYDWAGARGYSTQDEHIVIEGLPTQLLPAPGELAHEAILYSAAKVVDGPGGESGILVRDALAAEQP